MDLNARFDLRLGGVGTVVSWKGEAQVFGRLTSIAGGLLEPLARKNIQKVVASLQQAMNGQPEQPAGDIKVDRSFGPSVDQIPTERTDRPTDR